MKNMETKKCLKCFLGKDAEYFHWAKKGIKRQDICKQCAAIYSAAYYIANKERIIAMGKARMNSESGKEKRRAWGKNYRAKNKDHIKNRILSWNKENPKKVNEYQKKYKDKNHDKLLSLAKARYHAGSKEKKMEWQRKNPKKVAEIKANFRKNHPDRGNAYKAKRKCAKLLATPKWRNDFYIGEAYALATLRTKITGIKWHVDHIVPLQSKVVCGLHAETNLQVIPGKMNIKKHNKYWPDMPNGDAENGKPI